MEDVETLDDRSASDMSIVVRKRTPVYVYIGDFFNIVKAFIGTNYQGLPFAFAQSGLAFGLAGVFLIATLTDHCICLLIKCKYIVISNIIHDRSSEIPISADELHKQRQMLERGLGYGDIGRLSLGRGGKVIIDLAVWFTQLMTCVCYFIFIGNAVVSIYPLAAPLIPLNDSTSTNMSTVKPPIQKPLIGLHNLVFPESQVFPRSDLSYIVEKSLSAAYYDNITNTGFTILNNVSYQPTAVTWVTEKNGNLTTSLPPAPTPAKVKVSTAPSLKLLVMIPLPLFIITALIRNVRLLSPFSVIATLSLFAGAIAVLVYMIIDFTIYKDGFLWVKWATLPLFIGQITGAYEGIGCIVPIEGSMEGNRHVFPVFLHGSVYLVFTILCSFGAIGYLRYGEHVQQLIILSIQQHTLYAILIDVTLIISVACTFPLQFFPCVQIIEGYLFSEGAIFGPKKKNKLSGLVTERDPLLPIQDDLLVEQSVQTSSLIPASVSSWKRNLVRIIHVFVALGLAVLLRNNYAYMSSITGAIGASVLAFIIPCLVHLKLRWHELSQLIIIKDVTIVVVSIACSLATLIVFTIKLAKHEIKV